MSQAAVPLEHPIERCVSAVSAALDDAVESQATYLSPASRRQALVELSRQISRLEGLRAAVLAASGDIAQEDAARNPGAWLSHAARLDRSEGRRLQRLADALDQRYAAVAAALRGGVVSRAQAEVIAGALDALPPDLEPMLRRRAETHLVEQAADFGPRELRILGQRVLEVIAPSVAEEIERKAIEDGERRSRRRMRVTRRDLGNGLVRITADLPVLHADLLYTQLHAFASPRRDHLEGVDRRDPESGERLPYSLLLAQGFCSLLERLPREAMPSHGGSAATVVVTIDHDTLTSQLATAGLSTGSRISAGEARRLACNAGILPMVLGGASRPLDVGRKKRFHDSAMRLAMGVRDETCRAEGCDIPAAWCEAHHLTPWSEGGGTSVADGGLYCGFHHHRAHDRRYDMTTLPNGDTRFHRRT
jgi:hypothetical protein